MGNTARGCSLRGESNWEVEHSVIFDTLPRGKPRELAQCHHTTSGKDWQLPKPFCCSSCCTDPSSLLQKCRSMASSKLGQVLHVESNSISWKRYLFCLNHEWQWDVIFMFVLNQLRFRLELGRWFSCYSDRHARGRILSVCIYDICFTHTKIYLWSFPKLQGWS